MTDVSIFQDWLLAVMDKRGITQAELARRAGVTRSAINGVLTGYKGPGTELSKNIAKALNLPPEEVFRAAGLLPPITRDPWVERQTHKLSLISDPVLREIADSLIESLIQQEEAGDNKVYIMRKASSE